MRELMIRDGTLTDGTGRPYRTPKIAVGRRQTNQIGQVSGAASITIKADGLFVSHEWVDIHAAYDGQATRDPRLVPLLRRSR